MEHGNTISACAARMEAAVAQAREIKERIATLQRTAHGHEGECFACGQALSEQRAHDMLTRLQEESAGLKREHDAAQDERSSAQDRKTGAEDEVRQSETALKTAQQEASKDEQENLEATKTNESMTGLAVILKQAREQHESARDEAK